VYGSFCVRVGKGLFLKKIFWDWMKALKVVGFSFDLFGQPVIAHLDRLRSRWAHSENFCSLLICGCICVMLSVMMARSSAYAMVLQVVVDVLKW